MAISNRFIQKSPANLLESKYRINEQITAPELRVVDDEGEPLGVLSREDALALASQKGFDLIEVAAKADPPVARIASWSKFKFEQLKKEKVARKKNKNKEGKEMWFQPLIGKNDLEHKIKRVKEFLAEKHTVKLTIKMRGRVNYDSGKILMTTILADLADSGALDGDPKYEKKQIFALVRPAKK